MRMNWKAIFMNREWLAKVWLGGSALSTIQTRSGPFKKVLWAAKPYFEVTAATRA
jgi:hypothetical protein